MSPPAFQLTASAAAPPADDNKGVSQLQEAEGPVADGPVDAPAAEQAPAGLPEAFLEHLRLREGDRSDVYNDSRNLPTAGVGHLMSATDLATYPLGSIVPQAVRDAWLENDSRRAYDAATAQAATLGVTDQAFINALGAVNFQLGTAWNTEHRNTWAFMVAGDWEAAAVEAADSAWNTQTPVRVQDFQAALRALAGTQTATGANAGNGNVTALYAGSVTGDDVNVRSGPGTTNNVVESMNRGQAVEVFEELNGWVRVGEGRWIRADFVRRNAAPDSSIRPQARPEVAEESAAAEPEAAAPVTAVAAPVAATETGVITGDRVNVRTGPGTGNPTVGPRLAKDTPVSIFERRNGWVRIGENQWVSEQYIGASAVATPLGAGVISGANVNVRTGPGTNNPTVGSRLDRNTAVTIFERQNGWVRIGVGQWVSAEFVTEGNVAAAPSAEAATPVAEETAPPTSETTTETPAPATEGTAAPVRSVVITGSVGRGGDNARADVEAIQQLLSDIGYRIGVDGGVGKNTIGAIASFQEANGLNSDGRVDAGGGTLRLMNSTPNGAFHNTARQLQEDTDAPRFTNSRWTEARYLTADKSGEVIPRQHYGNMTRLIAQLEVITSNLTGSFNVNSGYRSPYHNSRQDGAAERSNHQFGRAVDIRPSDYTPREFRAELRRLIAEGKIHNGGIGLYPTFVHYDIDDAREWGG